MLQSWNETTTKKALIDFVERVTKKDSPHFVPEPERIAVFDNDGTLWAENPTYVEGLFAIDRMKEMVAKDPSLKDSPVFKPFIDKDIEAIHKLGIKGIEQFVLKTHEADTQEAFSAIASQWFDKAVYAYYKNPVVRCYYQPQHELLQYLRANGFKTFIVTGGGLEFVRAIAEKIYGIPPEQVIGSSNKVTFDLQEKNVAVKRISELKSFDDREEKVVNISLHIGRRPVFVFGNSDGDLRMMQYCLSGKGPRIAFLLHHDDAERERAYDKDFALSILKEALDVAGEWGIHVVSMKNDWKKVFAFE
jgi:phosphoglycolate phosphatase-like HAD superfamily hydrolase